MQVSKLKQAVDAAYAVAKVHVGKVAAAVVALQRSIARAYKERMRSFGRATGPEDSVLLIQTDGLLEQVMAEAGDLPSYITKADALVEGHFGRVRTAAEYLEDAVPLVKQALDKIVATLSGLREKVDAIVRSYISDGRPVTL